MPGHTSLRKWSINQRGAGQSILDTVLEMFSRSTKVLVVRFDLHVKEHSETNLILSNFSKMLTKTLYKNYAKTWFHLIWVREHGHSPCQHYHCVLLANVTCSPLISTPRC